MKTIIGGRRSGKTTALLHGIYLDGYSNPVIVVPNNTRKKIIVNAIQHTPLWDSSMRVRVITFKEYIDLCNGHHYIPAAGSGGIPTFYFDDIDACLQAEAPRVFVAGMTSPIGYNSISSIGGMSINVDDYLELTSPKHNTSTGREFPIVSFVVDDKPHIDHVKFNGPATIVFWKDGTKTVVKFDGEGAKSKKLAILYAFIRKIYGEGKNYHYILEEIDDACFSDK